jgi:hypothetical protein
MPAPPPLRVSNKPIVNAKPLPKPAPLLRAVAQRVAKPLALLPVLERVHLEATAQDLLLTEDVRFSPESGVQKEALELFVSFGVPGPPRALDVHALDAVATPTPTPTPSLRVEFAPHAPSSANVLFGTAHRAGFVIHVPAAVAVAGRGSDGFALRMRTLWAMPATAPRAVLVRLGAPVKEPVTIARIEYQGPGKLEARFCGAESAETRPLSVWAHRPDVGAILQDPFSLAPSAARRRPGDDLCLTVAER